MDCFEDGPSTIYCDARLFPVVLTRWVGTATLRNSERYAEWFIEQAKRAVGQGGRIVSISDASEAQRPPPEVRRWFSEWLVDPLAGLEVVSHPVVVIQSPLMRGAMTAIGWFAPKVRQVLVVESLDAAVEKALAISKEHRLPISPELTTGADFMPGPPRG